jgi:hypothetical protein
VCAPIQSGNARRRCFKHHHSRDDRLAEKVAAPAPARYPI